jgi:ankyrin repeat protein
MRKMRHLLRHASLAGLMTICTVLMGGCARPKPIQALIDAASNGDAATCEQLIHSALDWAIYRHQIDVVRKLVELGADVNQTDRRPGYEVGFTPLMYTATPFRGRKWQDPETMAVRNQIARLLIQHGADVNRATRAAGAGSGGGETALHFAVINQNPELIQMLLAAGAERNVKTDQGYTPMDIAKFPDYAPNTDVIRALGAN